MLTNVVQATAGLAFGCRLSAAGPPRLTTIVRQYEVERHLFSSGSRIPPLRNLRGPAAIACSLRHGALARGPSTAIIVRSRSGDYLLLLVSRTPDPLLVPEAGGTPFGGRGLYDSIRQPCGGHTAACRPMTKGEQVGAGDAGERSRRVCCHLAGRA